MNAKSLLILLATTLSCFAADPALTETPLPAVKGSVQIPQGWFVKEEVSEDAIIYQITREKVEAENDPFTAGMIITVTTKVPERASMKPSEYATELLSTTLDDPDSLKKSTNGPWQTFRTDYQIEGDPGPIHMANFAEANDTTGTIYFITWQSPESEEAKLGPVRESVLSSLKFDPAF